MGGDARGAGGVFGRKEGEMNRIYDLRFTIYDFRICALCAEIGRREG